MIRRILIIVLVLMLVGVLPTWGYSADWGVAPSTAIIIAIILLVIL